MTERMWRGILVLVSYDLVTPSCGAADAGRLFSDSMVWTLMHVISLVWVKRKEHFTVPPLLFPTKSVSCAVQMCSVQIFLQLSDTVMHISWYVK